MIAIKLRRLSAPRPDRTRSPGEAEIFFSRRVGLGPDGEQIPILGGVRLTGKVGRTQIGLVNIQTDSIGGAFQADGVRANNYGVARVKQELAPRSSVGFIFVNRQGTGRLAPSGDRNRTYAVDGGASGGVAYRVGLRRADRHPRTLR